MFLFFPPSKPSRPKVILEEDLPGSLRGMGNQVPLQGNLMADTFEHMQRRNMIPVTVHHRKKKRHVKRFTPHHMRQQWEIQEKQIMENVAAATSKSSK